MLWLFLALDARAAPLVEVWVAEEGARSLPSGVARGEGRRDGMVQLFAEPDAVRALPGAVPAARRLALPAGITPFEDGDALLHDLASRAVRGGLARWGTSVEGRPIDGLWLGLDPAAGAPTVRILGAHHGDEPSSAEVALALATVLVDGDGGDAEITAILDRSTVWLVPYVNPDGFVAGTRVNARGVDVNRNYDYQWDADAVRPGERPFSEPESAAVRVQAATQRPLAGLSLHSGAANIGWPWNYTRDDPEEAAALVGLAEVYAAACTAPGFWLTQGADWYRTNGDLNDWAYGRHGTLDYTVEVANGDTAEAVDWHLAAALAFLAIPPAVEGAVVDGETGAPIEASVWVDEGRPFTSDAATGRFATLERGDRLRVEAPGYLPSDQTLDGAFVEVALTRDGLGSGRLSTTVLSEPVDALGPFTLVRPGADPVAVEGALDPADLDPGWYSVQWPDGEVWPRALIVDHPTDATVAAWTPRADGIEVVGAGFTEGARAWVLTGAERVPVEVSVEVEDDEHLALLLPAIESPADAVIWVNGAILGIPDLAHPGSRGPPTGCSCATGTAGTSVVSIVLVPWLLTARRRSRP